MAGRFANICLRIFSNIKGNPSHKIVSDGKIHIAGSPGIDFSC